MTTSLILQNGIKKHKYQNSKISLFKEPNSGRNGAIFGFYNKPAMNAGRGFVMTSEESVLENESRLTHWTPNVYRYGTYTDSSRLIVKGHQEQNLSQINTFVVDIDSKDTPAGELVLACLDSIGYLPTLILESTNGYQIYFVLESPAYVTKHTQFKVIEVAKKISKTIREELSKQLAGIDFACNHFGIARFPNKKNIVYYAPEQRKSFKNWMAWSMKTSSDQNLESKKSSKLIIYPDKKSYRQVDEPWFELLLRKSNIVGGKGKLGRNNAIFTLALACYSSGYSYETCYFNLLQFNEQLQEPLKMNELTKILKSAYSGNYQAAHRDFILALCREWVSSSLQEKDLFISRKGWWKFKKPREQRTYTHLEEWEADFMSYLLQATNTELYVRASKKDLAKEIGIPLRSFDRLLKKLSFENKIVIRIKKGRNGGLTIGSVHQILGALLVKTKEEKERYLSQLKGFFNLSDNWWGNMLPALEQLVIQTKLRLDTG